MLNRQMSVKQYAEHRGCGDRAVSVALQRGRISRNAEGWIDPVQADIDWEKNTNPRMSAANKRNGAIGQEMRRKREQQPPTESAAEMPTPPPGPVLLSQHSEEIDRLHRARAVRERYAALNVKLDYEERSGQLINRREVESTTEMHAKLLQDQILAVPDRISAQLAAESDAAVVHSILDAELRLVLERVAAIHSVLTQRRGVATDDRAAVG